MHQASSHVGPQGTRLLRLLAQLGGVDVALSHRNFSERLGRLVDFGDSMRLAEFHDRLRSLSHEPVPTSSGVLREQVMEVRMALVRSVVTSFAPAGGTTRAKLPTLQSGASLDELATFEPYLRFYAAHQRNFEARIRSLQLGVGTAVSGVSVELARLVALDETVRDLLAAHVRKQLAVVPRLLGNRFEALRRECPNRPDGPEAGVTGITTWTRPGGWLNRFLHDMRGLLLAEVELRLLPVMGLVEAVEERAEKQS